MMGSHLGGAVVYAPRPASARLAGWATPHTERAPCSLLLLPLPCLMCLQSRSLLLSVGVEEPGFSSATVKIWELDKNDRWGRQGVNEIL